MSRGLHLAVLAALVLQRLLWAAADGFHVALAAAIWKSKATPKCIWYSVYFCLRGMVSLCRSALGVHFELPNEDSLLQNWWLLERARFSKIDRRWFDGMVCTVDHSLWKNRNA
jgi:hypothetical protein